MHRHKHKGMTLVETVVVVALIGLLVPTILYFLYTSVIINRRTTAQILNQQNARRALDKMAKEIREATTGTGNQYPLEVCQSNQITYYSDIDQDGTVEKVRYFLNGTTIQRGVINPSGTTYNAGSETVTTVMDHILNTAALPIFSYFDGNYTGSGAALSFPVNCTVPRMINISLKIDTNTEVLPGPFSISTMVQFRNLKSNL